jgi:hypothetical protein
VLDRLAPLAHGLRVLVEPLLHGFEEVTSAHPNGRNQAAMRHRWR